MTGSEIQRGTGIAAWRQIETRIRAEIADGLLQPGQQIGTETELSRRFGVNRHTVRRALAELAEVGLLSIEQGRGSFVRDQVLDYPIGSRTRFSEIIAAQDHQPSGHLIASEDCKLPADVAKHLGLRTNAKAFRLDILHRSDDTPVSVASNWFPSARFPGLRERYIETGSISKALAHFGVGDYRRVWTGVLARLPSRADADLLRQSPNRPVLVTEGVNADEDGKRFQFGRTRFAGERVQVVLSGESYSGSHLIGPTSWVGSNA